MVEYFGRFFEQNDYDSLLADIKLLELEGRNSRFVAVHMNNVDSLFNVTLAAFLLGAQENQFVGTGVVWE